MHHPINNETIAPADAADQNNPGGNNPDSRACICSGVKASSPSSRNDSGNASHATRKSTIIIESQTAAYPPAMTRKLRNNWPGGIRLDSKL